MTNLRRSLWRIFIRNLEIISNSNSEKKTLWTSFDISNLVEISGAISVEIPVQNSTIYLENSSKNCIWIDFIFIQLVEGVAKVLSKFHSIFSSKILQEIVSAIYLEISQASRLGIHSTIPSVYTLGILSEISLWVASVIHLEFQKINSLKIQKFTIGIAEGIFKDIVFSKN